MLATAILAMVLTSGSVGVEETDPAPAACPTTGDVVAVFTRKREIWLCRHGSEVGRIPVALGRGGNGKTRTGDHRTPVGTYAFVLAPIDSRTTRLIVRDRAHWRPREWPFSVLVYEPLNAYMETGLIRGVKRRAEAGPAQP